MDARSLLPHILNLLSRQPTLSADVDELCKALEPILLTQLIAPFETLRKAVDFAMDVGVQLGILSLKEEKRSWFPFKFLRSNAMNKPYPASTAYKRIQVTGANGKYQVKVTKAKAKGKRKTRRDAARRRR